MPPTPRIAGFRGEYLWELEIAERQLLALAEAIPEEKYDWWPDASARSVCEVFVHIAAGNFMLLDVMGSAPPVDLYGEVKAHGQERMWALVRRNDELEKNLRDKASVIKMLRQSLEGVNQLFSASNEDVLSRRQHFFGEETTVCRVYLRLLAHMHEHMGQMIGYARCMGISAPWQDWRPDRR
jgi:uncharacterized damage-inducible protein DinB